MKLTRLTTTHGGLRLSWVVFIVLVVGGCSSRLDVARDIAMSAGLASGRISTTAFDLQSYVRFDPSSPLLTVYLEGDGYAWITPNRLSDDPTPKDPVGLRLAARDDSGNVAYLARPCQYQNGASTPPRGCSSAYWSHARFAPEVILSEADAVRTLMRQSGASRLRLVGYSGGGTVALLLAQHDLKPELVITVSAVLDTAEWTRIHALSPLIGSENPAERAALSASIPQVHYLGEKDAIVPMAVAQSYRSKAGGGLVRVIQIPNFTHECCWGEQWPALLRQAEQSAGVR